MPRRAVPLVPGQYYHFYNRGVNRGAIFFERENYLYFIRELRRFLIPASDIIAYCLMPNHYHLLVQIHDDDFSHSMQLFGISYTKAINKRYQRVGALFQGAFQSRHITRNEDLLNLSCYIHLNPVLAGLAGSSSEWEFSSYLEFTGDRPGKLPQPGIILNQFPSPQAYVEFCQSGLVESATHLTDLMIDDND